MTTRIWRNAVWLLDPPQEGDLCRTTCNMYYSLDKPDPGKHTRSIDGCAHGDMFMFIDYFQTHPEEECDVPNGNHEGEYRSQYTIQALLCQGPRGQNVPNAGKLVYFTAHKTYLFSNLDVLVCAPDL